VITTHVLDLGAGVPAASVEVVLEQSSENGWRELTRTRTDADGRVRDFGATPGPGRFRLRFDTAGYLGEDAFFPEVALQFELRGAEEQVHVPLLLSPFGYSTYRGS
jgi:5-hydroxyisourate hydrolase